jgi:hypothetical protein
MQLGGVTGKFVDRFSLSAQLNQVNPALDHLPCNVNDIASFDVAQINNSI